MYKTLSCVARYGFWTTRAEGGQWAELSPVIANEGQANERRGRHRTVLCRELEAVGGIGREEPGQRSGTSRKLWAARV